MFSKACEYAIRAVVFIGAGDGKGRNLTLKAIASVTDSPEAFTAKVLQKLVHAGLVLSAKGPGGGFFIPPALARKVKLSHIVSAIDGDAIYTGCALGLPECSASKPCALHDHFLNVREDLRRMLERTTVQDLMEHGKGGAILPKH